MASEVVVIALPDASTRVTVAAATPAPLPCCTTCPARAVGAVVVVDEDVEDAAIGLRDWLHDADAAATANKTTRARHDIVGH